MAERVFTRATLASKLLPPAPPPTLVPRPRLEEWLRTALSRRLTTVIADAGFGKSTLLATWSARVPSTWYGVTAEDAALPSLARGIVDALRLRVPGLPPDIAGALGAARGPDAEADEPARAQAFAAVLAQALQEQLGRDLVLVLDGVDELGNARGAVRLVEALCRHAPPSLHLVLASRAEVPFRIDRLRGQGQVLELDGSDLAFTADEVRQLVADDAQGGTAAVLYEVTGGWPAAVRLAVEALRDVPLDERAAVLARVSAPGGSLFAYLATEVFAREHPVVRELVRLAARLERFTPDLCEELGIRGAAEIIASLARRGLFVEPQGRGVGWFALNALVRDFALASMPLEEREARRLHADAAAWLARRGHVVEALRALEAAADLPGVARLLVDHGDELLAAGAVESVAHATELVPRELRDATIERLAGEALQIRGDWEGALECFGRASEFADELSPAIAWRMGLIHHLRGRLDEALAVYGRAAEDDGDPRDLALLLAWRASAYWLRGRADDCRVDATRAFDVASAAGDPQALAAAHTVLAMLAALEGDRGANDAHYLRALDYAQRAGDVLQLIRVRTNRGSRHVEEGRYAEALEELDLALRLADLTGFTSFRALALSNRGEARRRLGDLEEAIADLEEARALYERLGSRIVSYPLAKLGEVYRERGDWSLARAASEEAVAAADAAGDVQGLVPALAGLARVMANDEPGKAEALAARALEFGPGMGHVQALLAAGWTALTRGHRAPAYEYGVGAAAEARSRRDRAGLAEALELQAVASPNPQETSSLLDEAVALMREVRCRLGEARVELTAALLAGDDERATAADERLRALGARGYRNVIIQLVPRDVPQSLVVQALGRFRLLRGGEPIPLTAWQSRKARDLLKILVARRGRPTPREYLMEALWPEQDPERLGGRLSVALSTVRSVLDPEKRFEADHFVAADRSAVWLELEHIVVDVETFLDDAAAALALRGDAADVRDRLARAEGSYAGDFLEEDAYEEWAVSLREQARATYVDVVRGLAEDSVANGDRDTAARYFLRLLEKDPYDERAHLGLVAALDAARRHGEARRHFRAYCARMEELGVESAPYPAAASP